MTPTGCSRDHVMRQLIGGRAVKNGAASASAMGRFETSSKSEPPISTDER